MLLADASAIEQNLIARPIVDMTAVLNNTDQVDARHHRKFPYYWTAARYGEPVLIVERRVTQPDRYISVGQLTRRCPSVLRGNLSHPSQSEFP